MKHQNFILPLIFLSTLFFAACGVKGPPIPPENSSPRQDLLVQDLLKEAEREQEADRLENLKALKSKQNKKHTSKKHK